MTPEEVNSRIATHEAVCAERYGNIKEDLGRLTSLVQWLCAGMATSLLSVLGYLLIHFVVK